MTTPRKARKPHKATTAKTSSTPRWALERLLAKRRRITARMDARPMVTANAIKREEDALYCVIMVAKEGIERRRASLIVQA